ncbi:YeeE/YedE family protein [Yoonia sediminilitoris]|uniref:Sulfur transporter n=1 Tax=Yoonia sediminilitoris TaxID=1286148 RepID=A0A2T6KI90_9RHOB|nr:YeeE/YedE family protein [Yoonia sediminilitoris]PUB15418.1 sulfur transporter [Yoonia sediminilitoris]RCW96028.1 sulfur transporter [Yoonia sediminilitoris]
MLLELLYDLGLETRTVHVLLGVTVGLIFGVAAQVSRFCLRRAVAGNPDERKSAAGVWMTALAIAILTVQGLSVAGFADLSEHRWLSADLPLAALIVGGLLFGAGMVLARGCASRLTVLWASGNLRALSVLIIFAITAHAMLKGVLAPVREFIGSPNVTAPVASLADLPGGAAVWAALTGLILLAFAARSGARWLHLALGAVIGLVVAVGWAATTVLLMDEFDPLPTQSIAFTLPWTETLFWTVASTAIPASFGTGFIGGVLGGAFTSALLRGELRLESFESPGQTLRYSAGGLLMGAGGVLAGGCTVGAGLAGGATLSVAALVALIAIVAGASGTAAALAQTGFQGARASA